MKKPRNILITTMSILLLCLPAAGCAAAAAESGTADVTTTAETVTEETAAGARIAFFTTDDIHGYLMDTTGAEESTFEYRMARIAKVVNDARASGDYDDVLLLDDGDIYQGTPVSNLTGGAAMRACMDMMQYDAVVLGNHEFDWGLEATVETDGTMAPYSVGGYSGDPSIPVLGSNLYDAETKARSPYTKDYVIVEKAGYRIALIGYLQDYSADIMSSRMKPYFIRPDYAEFSARVREIKEAEKPDVTIVMTHLKSENVAEELNPEDVDLVTGGHKKGGRLGIADSGIPYIQSDGYARGYASAVIEIDGEGSVDVKDMTYTPIADAPELLYDTPENAANLDPEILALSHAAWQEIGSQMAEYLGYIDSGIHKKERLDAVTTSGGSFITGLMLEYMKDEGAVAAIANKGGFRSEIEVPEGGTAPVTVGNIYAISPFNDAWFLYDLTGEELARHLAAGFADTHYGDQVSGLTYEYYNHGTEKKPDIEIASITLSDGTSVDIHGAEPKYRVVVSKFCAEVEGGVFEGKVPVYPEAEAPIDNQAMIELLRTRRDSGEEHIPTDNNPRGICLNADEVKNAA